MIFLALAQCRQIFIFSCILLQCFSSLASSSELTLAIADSTCKTMHEAGKIFTNETGIELNYICKSSGLLTQGIKAGIIKADYFISANSKWMSSIVSSGLIDENNVQSNWGNLLVIASPVSSPAIIFESINSLKNPDINKILIGDPGTAPFGRYAKEAMKNADIWDAVKLKIVSRKKISLAVKLLSEKDQKGMVGFLYKTNVGHNLRIDYVVPKELYSPILYYSAPLNSSLHKKEIEQFLTFVQGEKAADFFRSSGFEIL